MFSLLEPPFLTRLRDARRVLVAGAGGGFDVYAGLPLAVALRAAGTEVHLASLSFSDLFGLDDGVWVDPDVAAIRPDTEARGDYFPERSLARWLAAHDLPATVYAFPLTGVRPLRAAYRTLLDHLGGVDALTLARRNLYLDRLEDTALRRQISTRIEEFRDGLPRQRPPRAYPH